MKSSTKRGVLFLCGFVLAIAGAPAVAQQRAQFTGTELKEFTSLEPIDIHTHILKSDPAFAAMLKQLNLHVLDIFVGDAANSGSHQSFASLKQDSWQAVRSSGGRAKLSTSFDPFDWSAPEFSRLAIASIDKDFAQGALGVTIWTNSVTQFKDPAEKFVMADDPRLEPIYKDLASRHKPLISHTTAVDEAWVPDPGANGGEPVALAARDRVLEQNPRLRVVGAHLGSLKENIDRLASRLERYPNLAVDTASRMDYLMTLPKEQARAFILKFQDRILYGSDSSFRQTDSVEDTLAKWQNRYVVDWRYFSGEGTFEYRGRQVECLHLPQVVLRKLYHDNAARWVPGIYPRS